MKQRILLLLFVILICVNRGFATKVISASDDDWDNPLSWSTNEVPLNPDTIIIRHYITFGRDLTINAPTVVIIEEEGTLCGDYLMNVACGARVLNYGHWYLNTLHLSASVSSFNYNDFYFKNGTLLTGCGSGGSGSFHNVPPNGHINTWLPVLCKTAETGWPKATTGIPTNGSADEKVSISPNPINSGYLTIAAKGDFEFRLYDPRGALLYESSATNHGFIDLHDYANGFYFVTVIYKNQKVQHKVLVNH